MSERELREKMEKGLCFRCDGKWAISQCSKRELSVLLVAEGEREEQFEEEMVELCDDIEGEAIQTQLSMNSLVGLSSPRTMKLKGEISGREVVVMIDPGATHNFIASATVEELGLLITASGPFEVSLGNGEAVRGRGECRAVMLHLGSTTVIEDFYPLTLGNSDLVMGM